MSVSDMQQWHPRVVIVGAGFGGLTAANLAHSDGSGASTATSSRSDRGAETQPLAGSATAKAIDYSLNRWAALTRYLDDGDLPADNNWVENQIRPIAIGRNNWLFAGSLRAGKLLSYATKRQETSNR